MRAKCPDGCTFSVDRSIGGDGCALCIRCGREDEPFRPCPLAIERSTEDGCEGDDDATLKVTVAKDPWTDVTFRACQSCKTAYENWCEDAWMEAQTNGPNVEGGIGYRAEDTASYRAALKDAGRK